MRLNRCRSAAAWRSRVGNAPLMQACTAGEFYADDAAARMIAFFGTDGNTSASSLVTTRPPMPLPGSVFGDDPVARTTAPPVL